MGVGPAELDVGMEVRRLVGRHVPPPWQLSDVHDGLSLVEGGLDLDSVAIVELLVACEERFGFPFPADLLEGSPLTVGKLIDHARRRPGVL